MILTYICAPSLSRLIHSALIRNSSCLATARAGSLFTMLRTPSLLMSLTLLLPVCPRRSVSTTHADHPHRLPIRLQSVILSD